MTDFDADEPVAPLRPVLAKRRVPPVDRVLAFTGIALACSAALFPWYVFFNEGKFGVRLAEWGPTRDLPEGPGRNVFSVSPLALVDNDDDEDNSGGEGEVEAVDQIVTATVPTLGREQPEALDVPSAQPFPGKSGFRLLHVANGRALIEDKSGMFLVRVGSILPDNSRVATLEQRDGKWVIVTSAGEVVRNN
ncbi:MAG: flagellar protein [Alphaproteobacteria bacterium]|nr:flagellar protein [Alphaproteobacteria bacterium]MBU0834464.1 flagellar protein [Alphaproteobacteria bacterium]MBU1763157.1 flagellar protein [Alphaproteobacteria bacterium]MDM7979234.1 flagellar protein [Rhizobium sp.]MDM8015872.1 flagellar protein [Rhizobium sp.]